LRMSGPSDNQSAAGQPAGSDITRDILVEIFNSEEVASKKLEVERQALAVKSLFQRLSLKMERTADGFAEETRANFERCWKAIDAFLIGQPITDNERMPFNRNLRTTNFCIDLYNDHRSNARAFPGLRYLTTRQALLTGTTMQGGRFRLPTSSFAPRHICLRMSDGNIIQVPAVVTTKHQVFAIRQVKELRTLFGKILFAEEVQPIPGSLQPVIYAATRRRVILK